MTDPAPSEDQLGPVIESFLARFRAGQRPSLDDYAARHPALADQIHELLPALVEMERLGGTDSPLSPAPNASPPNGRPTPNCPERLGDYRVLREIGGGGMGIVYEAVRESLQSRVALKVVHPRFRTDSKFLRRFRTEARSAAGLHHTNIVSVFDFGEHDGVCYYAMQYIPGHGLDRVLDDVRRLHRSGPDGPTHSASPPDPDAATVTAPEGDIASTRQLSRSLIAGDFGATPTVELLDSTGPETTATGVGAAPRTKGQDNADTEGPAGSSSIIVGHGSARYHREIARLGAQVADALAHAHRRGVIHRDIKPANLLLDALGNVWVTDFGLAKFEEGDDLSHSRELVGTLRYMAPERFRGVSDRRGDIYALGATLYEMLALQAAFSDRDPVQLIDRITHEAPPSLRQLDRQVPRDLETIVSKAMAREPRDRYAGADELADELRRFVEGRPIRSRPVPAYERLWRWGRRNPWLFSMAAACALLAVTLAMVATAAAFSYRGQVAALVREEGRTRQANKLLREQVDQTEAAERAARLALGRSLMAQGTAVQRSGLVGQRLEALDLLGRAADELHHHPEGLALLPELRDRAVTAMGLVDLRPRPARELGPVMALGVDDSLERFAVVEFSGETSVRRFDDGSELRRFPHPGVDFWCAHAWFSPDGQYLLTAFDHRGSAGSRLRAWRIATGALVLDHPARSFAADFHPDGRHLLYAAPDSGIAVFDLVDRGEVRRLPLDFVPFAIAVNPAGTVVAANRGENEPPLVKLLDVPTGRERASWNAEVGTSHMDWSADGRLLAIGSHDAHTYVWDVDRGRLTSVLGGHTQKVILVDFAHAGYLLATGSWDNTTRLWDAVTGATLVSVPGLGAAISPDDRRMAFQQVNAVAVELADLETSRELTTLHPQRAGNRTQRDGRPGSDVERAAFSPDGRWLVTAGLGGFWVWETATGRELAHAPIGHATSILFQPDGSGVVVYGERGLHRWPIATDSEGQSIRLGPPELVHDPEPANPERFVADWLPGHRSLAMVHNPASRVLLVDLERREGVGPRALSAVRNRRMTTIAVSPDGRWAAAGGWKEAGIYLWDVPAGRLDRVLPVTAGPGDASAFASFSPDGRWLAANVGRYSGGDAYLSWHVGTWEPGPSIRLVGLNALAPPVFSAGGQLVAVAADSRQVLIAEAATGRELARLSTIDPLNPVPLAFSPDGTKLVAQSNQRTALLWDLRAIRDRLAPMGLDWDIRPFRQPSAEVATSPLSVRVVGEVLGPVARRAAERAELDRRIAANPEDVEALERRGTLFAREKRWAQAADDLTHAARLRPDDLDLERRRIDALSRVPGRGHQTRVALDRALARNPGDDWALCLRGRLALALDDPAAAEVDLTRLIEAEPHHPDHARLARIRAWLLLGRHDAAKAALDPLIAKWPRDANLHRLRACAYDALGHAEEARSDLDRARELLPNDPVALNNRAWALATAAEAGRDADQALFLAERAVALGPRQPLYVNTLGVARFRAGRYSEAIATLEASLAAGAGRNDAFDLFFLAMAHARLGDLSEARVCFDRAVAWSRTQPNLPPIHVDELNLFRQEAANLLDDLAFPPLPFAQ